MASARNGAQSNSEKAGDFEANFRKLQEVVRLLSEGNLTLQESLAAFEEGMSLADRCAAMLEQAELRVKEVSERARKAGSAAASELGQPLSISSGFDEPDLIEVEFERTLIIDSASTKAFPEEIDEPRAPRTRRGSTGTTGRGRVDPLLDELDPLFDENE
jgi:exodeoxyribonuclease VII small subunit